MQEARVQVETKEPISGEIRAYWFDLPIDTALFEEVLGIDAESDNYYITDKKLPFADEVREDTTILELNELYEMYQRLPDGIQEEYKAFLAYFESLEELYNYRNSILSYPDCKSMIDVARCKLRLNGIPVPPKRNGYSIFIGTKIIHPCYSVSLILIPFISKRYV